MNYLKFEFDIESADQQDKLVALLAAQGFEGFEEEENVLIAFIQELNFSEDDFVEIIDLFENVSFKKTIIENINWFCFRNSEYAFLQKNWITILV